MEEKLNENITKATREDANPALGNNPETTGEIHCLRIGNTGAPSSFPDDTTHNSKFEKAEPAKSGGSKKSGDTSAPSSFPDDATNKSKFEKAEAAKSDRSKESDTADLIVAGETGQIQQMPSAQTMGNEVSTLIHVEIQMMSDF
jgi:hypothetical protein